MSLLNEPMWVQIFTGTVFGLWVMLIVRMVVLWPRKRYMEDNQ